MGLLHQILGHRPTRSILDKDTANVWQDIDLRVDPDPFCISRQISTINKRSCSKTPLKSKTPYKQFFVYIIPATSSKILTDDTNFDNYLLFVDDYSIIPKLCVMENITTEEFIDRLDIFQEIFVKVHEFGWSYVKIIETDAATQFSSKDFHQFFLHMGYNFH